MNFITSSMVVILKGGLFEDCYAPLRLICDNALRSHKIGGSEVSKRSYSATLKDQTHRCVPNHALLYKTLNTRSA